MFTILRVQDQTSPCYYILEQHHYRELDEALLRRQIPQFSSLNEAARAKAFKRFLRSCTVLDCGALPHHLPNYHHPRDKWGHKLALSVADFRAGALALLSVGELFQDHSVGFSLVADLLGGMWCTKLRALEPCYQPVTSFHSTAPQIEEALTALVRAVVTRKRWKHKRIKIRRKAVLDYRAKNRTLPHHIQDFSRVKIHVPRGGCPSLKIPCPYRDTVALVIGASSQQLQEAAPYLQDAAVLLLNSSSCAELKGRQIRSSAIAAYNSSILENIVQERERISLILDLWRNLSRSRHAKQIIHAAKESFGPPDSRYISVILDPRKLNQAIRHQLLLAFLDQMEDYDLLTSEELTAYRSAIKDIYDPEPLPEQPIRHADDADVFLEAMRTLAAQSSIAGPDEPFRKADKYLGAWRVISGERYLVMPEDRWAKAYRKWVREDKAIDSTLFQKDGWEKALQKLLAERELIKAPSAGSRYRYDLYGLGKRDNTYVVAVPAALLNLS